MLQMAAEREATAMTTSLTKANVAGRAAEIMRATIVKSQLVGTGPEAVARHVTIAMTETGTVMIREVTSIRREASDQGMVSDTLMIVAIARDVSCVVSNEHGPRCAHDMSGPYMDHMVNYRQNQHSKRTLRGHGQVDTTITSLPSGKYDMWCESSMRSSRYSLFVRACDDPLR